MIKRILFITPVIDRYSGSAINELQLARALSKFSCVYLFGFKTITSPSYFKKLNHNNALTVFWLPTVSGINTVLYPFVSTFLSLVANLLLFVGFLDLIYCRDSLLAIGFMVFKKSAKRTVVKIPCLVEDEVRGFFQRKLFSLVYNISDKICIRKAGFIGVQSTTFASYLFKKRKALSQNKSLIIPAGVDLGLIERVKKLRNSKEDTKRILIGFLGTLSWWQGSDLLVQALGIIRRNTDWKIKLCIVGDGPERAKVEKLCKKNGIDYTITGFVSHEKALELLSTFHMLVLPRHRTPTTEAVIPIKIMEAWSLGIPVIATKHKVFVENLRDNENIVLCEEDPADIAMKITNVLKDSFLRSTLACQGLALANHYSYDQVAANIVHTLSKLV